MNYEELKEPQQTSLGDGQTVKAYGKGDTHFTMIFKMSDSKEIKCAIPSMFQIWPATCFLSEQRLQKEIQ